MLDLALSVLCAAGLGHIMKLSLHLHAGQTSIITLNYVVAVIGSIILVLHTAHTMTAVAIVAGIVGGVLYVLGLLLEFVGIRINGLGLTATAAELGIAVPVILSLTVWHEEMTPTRLAGLVLTTLALPLLTRTSPAKQTPVSGVLVLAAGVGSQPASLVATGSDGTAVCWPARDADPLSETMVSALHPPRREPRRGEGRLSRLGGTRARRSLGATGMLVGLFLVMGISQVTAKVQQEGTGPTGQAIYLLTLFGTALLGAMILQARRPEPVTWREVELGAALGLVNLGAVLFLLRALAELPATVVFPASSCGSLLLIVITARWIWQEHPTTSTQWGIGAAVVAVGLLAT